VTEKTILVVEDDDVLLELLRILFESKGFKVMTSKDGQDAIQLFKKNAESIPVVISDMGLPNVGGWEVLRRLKEINPTVKVILSSGFLKPELREEMIKQGAVDFIQKPYNVKALVTMVTDLIEKPKVDE
jgi:DNA-binding NtrC family response regulator